MFYLNESFLVNSLNERSKREIMQMCSHSRMYLFIYSNNKQTFEELVNTVINTWQSAQTFLSAVNHKVSKITDQLQSASDPKTPPLSDNSFFLYSMPYKISCFSPTTNNGLLKFVFLSFYKKHDLLDTLFEE